jgi:hypothetical protein
LTAEFFNHKVEEVEKVFIQITQNLSRFSYLSRKFGASGLFFLPCVTFSTSRLKFLPKLGSFPEHENKRSMP